MNIERYLRLIAGFFVMASVALGYWVHPDWFLFTAFVGLNLFQSAFTNWCPMITISAQAWGSVLRGPDEGSRLRNPAILVVATLAVGLAAEFALRLDR